MQLSEARVGLYCGCSNEGRPSEVEGGFVACGKNTQTYFLLCRLPKNPISGFMVVTYKKVGFGFLRKLTKSGLGVWSIARTRADDV